MTSRMTRIVRRSPQPSTDRTGAGQDRANAVLAQVRAGLDILDQRESELSTQEQHLLVEASAHYEQLARIAADLDEIRQQRSEALAQRDELRSAMNLLEGIQTGASPAELPESHRSESLIPSLKGSD